VRTGSSLDMRTSSTQVMRTGSLHVKRTGSPQVREQVLNNVLRTGSTQSYENRFLAEPVLYSA